MPRSISLYVRLAFLLALVIAGPLVVRRFSQVAFWTPEFVDAEASFGASAGGRVQLLRVYRGIAGVGRAGRGLAGAGDVDGDGLGDLVMIAPEPARGRGGTFCMRGSAGGGKTDNVLHRWLLPDPRRPPYSVEALGDLDGDGVTDVLIGQGTDDSWFNRVYWVCSGRTGRPLVDVQTRVTRDSPAVRAVPSMSGNGVRDLVIVGDSAPALLDSSRAAATLCLFEPTIVDADSHPDLDVDGDGRAEVALLRTRDIGGKDVLVVEIVSTAGGSPTVLRQIFPSAPRPPAADEVVVLRVLGDTDGDGIADVAIGTPGRGLEDHGGALRVLSGATGAELFALAGAAGEGFGASVASLGDLDGDGRCDFAVGGNRVEPPRAARRLSAIGYAGSITTVSAALSARTTVVPAPAAPASLPASPPAPSTPPPPRRPGFVQVHSGADGALLRRLEGKTLAEQFGHALSSVGDLDGDGVEDLAVEAPGDSGTSPSGALWRGSVWIFSGASLGRPP